MGTARLGDFGLMIMTDLSTVLLSNTVDPFCGTIRWTSPELLYPAHFESDGIPSRESDCYALGMVVYEVNRFLRSGALSLTHFQVLNGLPPFNHLRSLEVLCAILTGASPRIPPNASSLGFTDTLWRMLQSCWSRSTSSRPTARQLYDYLHPASATWVPPPTTYPATGGGAIDTPSSGTDSEVSLSSGVLDAVTGSPVVRLAALLGV